jgi:hypothetical protein
MPSLLRRNQTNTAASALSTGQDEGERALSRYRSNSELLEQLSEADVESSVSTRDEGDRLLARMESETETPLQDHLPLSLGAKGDAVTLLQERLVAAGAEITVDGDFGRLTENMVRAFQVANGLYVTGTVYSRTAARLYSDAAVSIDEARLGDLPGIHLGRFETWDSGELTGSTDVVWLDGVRMDARLVPHWVSLRDAAAADGVTLRLNSDLSGFRTHSDQQRLYEKYGSPRAVPAGYSNHQDGEALDIVMSSAVEAWLSANAADYGWVRPTYEDWHWEYRG